MRKLFLVAVVVVCGLAVPAAHSALAAPAAKVKVCHVNGSNTPATLETVSYTRYSEPYGDNDFEYSSTQTWWFGNVIEVPANAVPAHERHGDSKDYFSFGKYQFFVDKIETWDELDTMTTSHFDGGFYSYDTTTILDYTNGDARNADCFFMTLSVN